VEVPDLVKAGFVEVSGEYGGGGGYGGGACLGGGCAGAVPGFGFVEVGVPGFGFVEVWVPGFGFVGAPVFGVFNPLCKPTAAPMIGPPAFSTVPSTAAALGSFFASWRYP
jgi:hypothetical protein